jgi:hypothetical protein
LRLTVEIEGNVAHRRAVCGELGQGDAVEVHVVRGAEEDDAFAGDKHEQQRAVLDHRYPPLICIVITRLCHSHPLSRHSGISPRRSWARVRVSRMPVVSIPSAWTWTLTGR